MGVEIFETWVWDSHTCYLRTDNYILESMPQYDHFPISENPNKEHFTTYLKNHQQGMTDYNTFCIHCAETGIEKWVAHLHKRTCTYYDKQGNETLVEQIPK